MTHFTNATTCKTALALLLSCLSMPATAQEHAGHGRASEPASASPLSVPLDAATLATLTPAAVSVSAHGKTLNCQGVRLSDLLRKTNALPDELRGPALASYVLVTARDGYRVVYSLAELDTSLGDRHVILANQCNGQPLDEKDGPLRLIASEELRPARWVRQVQSITVVRAP